MKVNFNLTCPVAGFRTRDNDPTCNFDWPIYIPARDQGYHLGSPDILPFNIASKT